jgi:phospholipid/cholesterol/gamma-HCH transport system substrate-binding protein
MRTSRTVEILVGMFLVLGMAAFIMLALKVSNITTFTENDVFQVTARFENIGGLKVRSPVRMGGVRIGRIGEIRYDDQNLEAVVTMEINQKYQKIPNDSEASIYTAGLLGEQYISLEPGGSSEFFIQGDEVEETQSALVLERMVGRFLINASDQTNSSSDN